MTTPAPRPAHPDDDNHPLSDWFGELDSDPVPVPASEAGPLEPTEEDIDFAHFGPAPSSLSGSGVRALFSSDPTEPLPAPGARAVSPDMGSSIFSAKPPKPKAGDPNLAAGSDYGSAVIHTRPEPGASGSHIFDVPPSGSSRFTNPADATDSEVSQLLGGDRAGADSDDPMAVFAQLQSPTSAGETLSQADFALSSREANDILDELDLPDEFNPSQPSAPGGSGSRPDYNRAAGQGSSSSNLFGREASDIDFGAGYNSDVDLLRPNSSPGAGGSGADFDKSDSIFQGELPSIDGSWVSFGAGEGGADDRTEAMLFDDTGAGSDDALEDGGDDIFQVSPSKLKGLEFRSELGSRVNFALPGDPGDSNAERADSIQWGDPAGQGSDISARLSAAEADALGIPDLGAITAGSLDPSDDELADLGRSRYPAAPPAKARPDPRPDSALFDSSPDVDFAAPSPRRPRWVGPAAGAAAGAGVASLAFWLLAPAATPDKLTPPPVANSGVAAVDRARALADARLMLGGGEPEAALPALDAAGDSVAVDVLADRAKARWLSRVRELARDNAPANAGDAQLKQAGAEFERVAKESDPATDAGRRAAVEATLYLGLTREVAGDPAGAAEVYAAAATRFPAERAVFDAAIARLKATGKLKSAAPRAALGLADAVAVVVALIEPPADAKAGPGAEAGFAFWRAAQSAAEGDYAAAITAIGEARAAHEARRLKLAGRGLNPLSDPLEQIFTKACDDLREFYALKRDTYQHPGAGPLFAKLGPAAGLDKLVADAKAKPPAAAAKPEPSAREKELEAQVARLEADSKASAARLEAKIKEAAAREGDARAEAEATAKRAQDEAQQARAALAKFQAAMPKANPAAPPANAVKPEQLAAEAEAKRLQGLVTQSEARAKGAEVAAREAGAKAKAIEARFAELEVARAAEVAGARKVAEEQVAQSKAEAARLAKLLAEERAKPPMVAAAPPPATPANPPGAPTSPAPALRPMEAEYARSLHQRGVDLYFAGRPSDALALLADATRLDGQDALQWYFLGLAQSATGFDPRGAFQKGAELERQGRPGRKAVNAALERVQGAARQQLGQYRP